MSIRRSFVGAVALAVALAVGPSGWAQDAPQLSVGVDRSEISTLLGEKFTFRSTITNPGSAPLSGLIAHLNVLSLREGTYVDPEDWSSDRTRYLEPIPPGGSLTTTWQMQAVNDGSFGVFVAVLPETGESVSPTTGPTIRLEVASRRTLNPSGMVPVALGIPAFLGILALAVRIARRG